MRNPLVPVALAFASGILAARQAELTPGDVRLALAGFAVLLILGLALRAALGWRCALWALIAACGAWTALAHRGGPAPELDAKPGEAVWLDGCIASVPAVRGDQLQFVVEIAEGARARVVVPLNGAARPSFVLPGRQVEIAARLAMPHNFRNPGSFDYVGWLATRSIYWIAPARKPSDIRDLGADCGNAAARGLMRLRLALLDRIDRLYRDDTAASALLGAALFGEDSRLERADTDQYRRTGTYHALVISGLHVSLIAAIVLAVLRICWVPRSMAIFASSAATWFYAFVAGAEAPVMRAAAGFTLFALARLFFRRGRVLNLLALVVLVFLAVDPQQLYEPGFQLSVLAVASIGALAAPVLALTSQRLAQASQNLDRGSQDLRFEPALAQWRIESRLLAETAALWLRVPARPAARIWGMLHRWGLFVFDAAFVSAAVQLGLSLPLVYYFHRLPVMSLPANLIVTPLLSAVVPSGLLAICTGWGWTLALTRGLLGTAQWAAAWHASWEPFWRIPSPPLWLAIVLAASLVFLAFAGRLRWFAAPAIALAVASLYLHPFDPRIDRDRLEVTFIDVGQGDSILVVFPNGKTALVDSGGIPTFGRPKRPRLDIGEDVVSPYLWTRSFRRLDFLVLTHAHEDHSGGLAALIENFQPREIWTGAQGGGPAWRSIRELAKRQGIALTALHGGQEFSIGHAKVSALSPGPDYEPGLAPANNDSLVLRIDFGNNSVLLTGDAEREVENRLVESGELRRVDLLKVGHHGSKTSTTEPFLELLRPGFAVISAGPDNPYHHPHPSVVDRIGKMHSHIFRTDQTGLVRFVSDGKRWSIDRNGQ